MANEKSNDVLAEQIKMLYKMQEDTKKTSLDALGEIKAILNEMRSEFVTAKELQQILALHEEKSKSRHNDLERDVAMMKRTLWWVVSTLGTTITAISVAIFNYYFK